MEQRVLLRGVSLLSVGIGLLFLFTALPPAPGARAAGEMCDNTISTAYSSECPPGTHYCTAQVFSNYVERNGGLELFGYPITGIAPETQPDGNCYWTQWFQRRRLEIHPKLEARYYISEGLLGNQRLKQLGRSPGSYSIDAIFRLDWTTRGLDYGDTGTSPAESTALFGNPITPPAYETNGSGWNGWTQWFERSRFEWHTEYNPNHPIVQWGLLGAEINLANGGGAVALINQTIRAGNNLPPLDLDTALNLASQNHANYLMLNYDDLKGGADPTLETPGKPGFTGVKPADRARAAGYTGADLENVTEVVALFGDPQKAVAFWAQQPDALARLQNPKYRLMGYGYGQLTVDPNTGRGLTGVDVVDLGTGGAGTALCSTFESLKADQTYSVGASFDDGSKMTPLEFVWSNGTPTADGFARVATSGLAGGSGQDLNLNTINVGFDFGTVVHSLTLRFGEYGGNINIRVNGDFRNFGDFADIDQKTIGNVAVAVNIYDPRSSNGSGDRGILTLTGPIDQFALGGQELWIDDVCAQP